MNWLPKKVLAALTTLLLTATALSAQDLFYTGMDQNWSNPENWSTTENGTGGFGTPTEFSRVTIVSTTPVYFNQGSPIAVKSLVVEAPEIYF
ncbi:MAG: hypothetical protein AAF193_11190, partial [Bacteroidota bacterium]